MKKIFTLFLSLVVNVGIIFASDIEIGGIWYDFDFSTLTATVTYQGQISWEVDDEYTGSLSLLPLITTTIFTPSEPLEKMLSMVAPG